VLSGAPCIPMCWSARISSRPLAPSALAWRPVLIWRRIPIWRRALVWRRVLT
jgi:hypothetical protein